MPRARDVLLAASACAAFGLGLAGFTHVRPPGGAAPYDLLHALYYTLCLYVLHPPSGRGLPAGDPAWAVSALWAAHFLAPLSLATVVVDACLSLLARTERSYHRRQGHTIVSGLGRTGLLCVEELVKNGSASEVVVLELHPTNPHLAPVRALGVAVVLGSMTDERALRRAGIEGARRFLALASDDLLNLNAATLARRLARAAGFAAIAQIADAKLQESLPESLKREVRLLNTHEVSAEALVRERRLARGYADAYVIAGFGNFGQMALKALLREDAVLSDRFFVLDRDAEPKTRIFLEAFGFEGRDVRPVAGDLHDPAAWRRIREGLAAAKGEKAAEGVQRGAEPIVLVCTDNDVLSLSLALSIRRRHVPEAVIHCRVFGELSFEPDMVRGQRVETYRVADLLRRNLPGDLLGRGRGGS